MNDWLNGCRRFLAALVWLALIPCSDALAVKITSTVFGDIAGIAPFTVDVEPSNGKRIGGPPEPTLIHGDILVNFANDLGATSSVVGDGKNEESWFVWDFSGDANFASFNASTDPLTSAWVTLDLKPTDQFYTTSDSLSIPGLSGSHSNPSSPLPGALPDSVTIEFELIGTYSAGDILSKYLGGGAFGPNDELSNVPGALPGKYFDDSSVRSATMTLTRGAAVAEPATMFLVGLGAFGLLRTRRST